MLDNKTLSESIQHESELRWRKMLPPTQLWKLLAPPGSTLEELTSAFFANINTKTYMENIEEAQWAHFLRCARFVEEFQIERHNSPEEFYAPQRKLIGALVARNNGQPIFPILRTLCWAPSSKDELDMSYLLLTSTLHAANFDFGYTERGNIEDSVYDYLLLQLTQRSEELRSLSLNNVYREMMVGSSWGINALTSFKHLTRLYLSPYLTLEAFHKLATMPTLEFLQVKVHIPSNATMVKPQSIQTISAPRLLSLSIGGTCTSLTRLFYCTHLVAPSLASISCDVLSDYEVLAKSFGSYSPVLFMKEFSDSVCSHRCTVEALHDLCLQFGNVSDKYMFSEDPLFLANLVRSLCKLKNIKNFMLSCPTLELVADDDVFKCLARAWTGLQTFTISQDYYGEDGDGEPGLVYSTPTPAVLQYFRNDCPDLRELMLPYLDLSVDVPKIEHSMTSEKNPSDHGLSRLVLEPNDEFEVGQRKTGEWAHYIHSLFPKLDVQESISHYRYKRGSLHRDDWDGVLECLLNLNQNSLRPVA